MATEKDLLSNWDFGFSTVSEEELEKLTAQAVEDSVKEAEARLRKEITQVEKTVQYYQDKLIVIEKMIMPLLNNLASNPEKTYIYWPNRQQKLAQFKEMLLDELRN